MWSWFPSMLIFLLLAACAQDSDKGAQSSPAVASAVPPLAPTPIERTANPSVPVVARTREVAKPVDNVRTISAIITGGGVGTITGYRSSVVTLYATDSAMSGVEVATAAFGGQVPVLTVSDMNKRLKVRTNIGDRWIDPIDVEYSGTLSEGQPAIRTKKHSAGGRGID